MQVKDIAIDYLSFHYMGEGKNLDGLKHGGTSQLDKKVHDAYAKYLSTISTESSSTNCYDVYKPVSGDYGIAKKEFDAILRMVLPEDRKRADECTLKLAKLLKDNERASVPGVFFLVLFRHKGIRYVSILKLDIFNESWASYEERTAKMTYNEIVGELPSTEAKFRKGSIYPHPNNSSGIYIRVYQKDNPSKYFDQFLGGERRVRARAMINEFRNIVRRITGGWPNFDETCGLYDGLKSHVGSVSSMIDKKDMIEIITAAVPSNSREIKETVEKHAKIWGVISAEDVLNLQIEVQFENVKLKGPVEDLRTKFKYQVGGRPDKHQIESGVTGLRVVKE